jgi:hypothetical protein
MNERRTTHISLVAPGHVREPRELARRMTMHALSVVVMRIEPSSHRAIEPLSAVKKDTM